MNKIKNCKLLLLQNFTLQTRQKPREWENIWETLVTFWRVSWVNSFSFKFIFFNFISNKTSLFIVTMLKRKDPDKITTRGKLSSLLFNTRVFTLKIWRRNNNQLCGVPCAPNLARICAEALIKPLGRKCWVELCLTFGTATIVITM